MASVALADALASCPRGRRIIVLLAHEGVEADTVSVVGRSGRASSTAASNRFNNFTVEKAGIAIIICGAGKLHLTSLSVTAEGHHEALNVHLGDARLLVHLLYQLRILRVLLEQHEALLVVLHLGLRLTQLDVFHVGLTV